MSGSRGLDPSHIIRAAANQEGPPALSGTIAAVTAPGEFEYQKYDLPKPTPGALLLQVVRANACGSELHIWRGHHPVKKRGSIGHEMVGRVLALGEGVAMDYAPQPIAVGDRIVATYFQTCLRCPPCVGGQYNLCDNDLLDADFSLDEVKLALDKSAKRDVTRASIICETA